MPYMIKPVVLDTESFVLASEDNHSNPCDCIVPYGWFVLTNSLPFFFLFWEDIHKIKYSITCSFSLSKTEKPVGVAA